MTQTQKIPGPDHPITVAPAAGRITVRVGDTVLADTTRALTLKEASYPAVHYIPRADVAMAALVRSTRQTTCPYKGQASYFSIPAAGAAGTDAVWSYEDPFDAVGAIREHLAFYPDRVTITLHPAG